jgi:hypothetical protein
MSMAAQFSSAQTAIIEYDGLYYLVDDADGTARVVNREYIESYTDYYSLSDYQEDIVIPEEIVLPYDEWDPEYEDVSYNHTFSYITQVEGDPDYFYYNCFTHRTFRVSSIGTAFRNSWITSITMPESITSIENEAFRDCFGLTSVTIPNSVTSIGEYAFYRCI